MNRHFAYGFVAGSLTGLAITIISKKLKKKKESEVTERYVDDDIVIEEPQLEEETEQQVDDIVIEEPQLEEETEQQVDDIVIEEPHITVDDLQAAYPYYTYFENLRKPDILTYRNYANTYLSDLLPDEPVPIERRIAPVIVDDIPNDDEEEYARFELTYYADKLLVDDMNELVEDVKNKVGYEALTKFNDEDIEVVRVRNDELRCYYEIVRDPRSYYDIARNEYDRTFYPAPLEEESMEFDDE